MSHTHQGHKHHKGQGGKVDRKAGPIGMVQQRAGLATVIAAGLVVFAVLGVLALVAYALFG